MILAVDSGSSTTDVVVLDLGKVVKSYNFSSEGFDVNEIDFEGVKQVNVTGCGADKVIVDLKLLNLNVPIKKVDEIRAIGLGGLFVSGLSDALVVSVGSGTCMVSARAEEIKHVGGTAIGGRTLSGLGKLILGDYSFDKIEELAVSGDLSKVDLTMEQIYPEGIGILSANATASHFGNLVDNVDDNDKALALLNMVAQSIGTLAFFAAKAYSHDKIILTGKLTKIKLVEKLIKDRISFLSSVDCLVCENSQYATAIGAGLS